MQKRWNRKGQTFVQWLLEVWAICDWRARKPRDLRRARRWWRDNVTAERFADPTGELAVARLNRVAREQQMLEFGARRQGKTRDLLAVMNEVCGTQALRNLCSQTGLPHAMIEGLPERGGPGESRAREAAFVFMGPRPFSIGHEVVRRPQVVLLIGDGDARDARVGELTAADLTRAAERLGGRRIHPDDRFKRMYLDAPLPKPDAYDSWPLTERLLRGVHTADAMRSAVGLPAAVFGKDFDQVVIDDPLATCATCHGERTVPCECSGGRPCGDCADEGSFPCPDCKVR